MGGKQLSFADALYQRPLFLTDARPPRWPIEVMVVGACLEAAASRRNSSVEKSALTVTAVA
ncbi:MAG: hypothetical protein ACJ8DO_19685, partial [Microvirga sp.]